MLGYEPHIVIFSDAFVPGSAKKGARKSESGQSAQQKPTVLVVDDQKLIVDTVTEILGMYDFHAVPAYGGKEALELVAKIRPDYLLTDVLMPEMNGIELAIAVRDLLPSTKILLFSGQAGISNILVEGQQRGYEFDLIAKPIHPSKLIEILKNKR
jgi:CheY-like chemotaxis protein